MQQFAQWERSQIASQKKPEKEAVKCTQCESTWFETVDVYQYDADHHIILGQEVPKLKGDTTPYRLLRCIKCSMLLEPRIMRNLTVGHDYDQLLDMLEAPQAKAPEKEKTEEELLKQKIEDLEKKLDILSGEKKPKGRGKKKKEPKKEEKKEDDVQS